MTTPQGDGLEVLRAHFSSLRIGAVSVYETTFNEQAVEEYARRGIARSAALRRRLGFVGAPRERCC